MDNVTSFMWQQEDDDKRRDWEEAYIYCGDLAHAGYSDWRLPSKRELMSIINYGTYNPSKDTMYFFNTNSSDYWASATYICNLSEAWYIDFNYSADCPGGNKTNNRYVRCVRGGQ